jgi:hypothetical protein
MAQNFSLTPGVQNNIDYTNAALVTANKLMLIVKGAKGNAVLSKNTANNGGSNDELEIVNGVKAIMKFTAAETAVIITGSAYVLYKWNTSTLVYDLLETGSITITGVAAEVSNTSYMPPIQVVRQSFDENGDTDFLFPANTVLLNVIGYADGGDQTLDITDDSGVILNDHVFTDATKEIVAMNTVLNEGNPGVLSLSAASWGAGVVMWFTYYVFEVF